MSRREHLDARDVGISASAAAALGPFLAEEPPVVSRHLVLPKSAKTPAYEPSRTACGIDGIEPNTNVGTTSEHSVTCATCLQHIAKLHAKKDLSSLTSLKKAALHRSKLFGSRRWRLETAGLAKVDGDFVVITDAGIAHIPELKKLVKGAA